MLVSWLLDSARYARYPWDALKLWDSRFFSLLFERSSVQTWIVWKTIAGSRLMLLCPKMGVPIDVIPMFMIPEMSCIWLFPMESFSSDLGRPVTFGKLFIWPSERSSFINLPIGLRRFCGKLINWWSRRSNWFSWTRSSNASFSIIFIHFCNDENTKFMESLESIFVHNAHNVWS